MKISVHKAQGGGYMVSGGIGYTVYLNQFGVTLAEALDNFRRCAVDLADIYTYAAEEAREMTKGVEKVTVDED